MRYLECLCVFTSPADQDMGNYDIYKFTPCMIDLSEVSFINQSYDSKGNPEPYVDISFNSGKSISINKTYQEVLALLKQNQILIASN